MNALLAAALEYAAQQIPVFPLHGMSTGRCGCSNPQCASPGKHPLTAHGHLEATTDLELIKVWWTRHPDSNIGIPTGKRSGWSVIDQDDGDLPEPLEGVPVVRTHGERRHHWVEAGELTNATGVVPGVDVRGEGGYVVAPPSLHHSGDRYVWEVTLEEGERRPAPAWLMEATRKSCGSHAEDMQGGGDLSEYLRAMSAISVICPDTRLIWQRVGTAVKALLGDAGFWIWDSWSRGSTLDNYTASTQRAQWKSFRVDDGTAESIGEESLWWLATSAGWVESGVGEPVVALPVVEALPFPTSAIDDMPPLMRLAYDWILARSIRPQPILAFAGTLALFSTLCGRRYGALPNIRSGLYIMSIAATGTGKDGPRSAIRHLLTKAGLADLLGGEDLASDAGLWGAMERNPLALFQLDEVGEMLHRWSGNKAPSHERGIKTSLLSMYSAGGEMLRGKEYSQSSKDKRPRIDLDAPCIVIHGTTTPKFWDAMDDADAESGLLSRLIVFENPRSRPRMNAKGVQDPPHELVTGIKALRGMAGDIGDVLESDSTMIVEKDSAFEEAADALDESVNEMGREMNLEGCWDVLHRLIESAQRMALIHAVVSDPVRPVLRVASLQWGEALARYSTSLVAQKLETSVSSSPTGKKSNKIFAFIERKAPNELSASEITKAFQGIPPRERKELLADLVEAGRIVSRNREGKGRTAVVYSLPSQVISTSSSDVKPD